MKWKYFVKAKLIIGKFFWSILPYACLIAVSAFFFFLPGSSEVNKWNNLWLSISSNTLSIFIAYFVYELIKTISNKKLNKEIFDHAKRFADADIHIILYKLSKFIHGFEKAKIFLDSSKLLQLKPNELESFIKNRNFIGFELFKSWDETHEYFSKILENNFILSRLDDDQIVALLSVERALKGVTHCFQDAYFVDTNHKASNYIVQDGKSINPKNIQFPNRYLLLRDIKDGKSIVEDFGDFSLSDAKKLLNIFTINPKMSDSMVMRIYKLLQSIKKWIDLTGEHPFINLGND